MLNALFCCNSVFGFDFHCIQSAVYAVYVCSSMRYVHVCLHIFCVRNCIGVEYARATTITNAFWSTRLFACVYLLCVMVCVCSHMRVIVCVAAFVYVYEHSHCTFCIREFGSSLCVSGIVYCASMWCVRCMQRESHCSQHEKWQRDPYSRRCNRNETKRMKKKNRNIHRHRNDSDHNKINE